MHLYCVPPHFTPHAQTPTPHSLLVKQELTFPPAALANLTGPSSLHLSTSPPLEKSPLHPCPPAPFTHPTTPAHLPTRTCAPTYSFPPSHDHNHDHAWIRHTHVAQKIRPQAGSLKRDPSSRIPQAGSLKRDPSSGIPQAGSLKRVYGSRGHHRSQVRPDQARDHQGGHHKATCLQRQFALVAVRDEGASCCGTRDCGAWGDGTGGCGAWGDDTGDCGHFRTSALQYFGSQQHRAG